MTVPCPDCKDGTVTYGSGWKARTARCSTCAGTGSVVAADSDHENYDRAVDEHAVPDPYDTHFEPSWGLENVAASFAAMTADSCPVGLPSPHRPGSPADPLPDTRDTTRFDQPRSREATPSAGAADGRPGAPSTS